MALDLAETVLVAMRWAHLLAAVAFVGSAIFSLVVLAPRIRSEPAAVLSKAVEASFREVVDVSVVVFLLSGAILTFDRLSSGRANTLYAALLGLKIALALGLFSLAYRSRRTGLMSARRSLQALIVGSSLVLLLAIIVRAVFEAGA